jgi:hypothetical protein
MQQNELIIGEVTVSKYRFRYRCDDRPYATARFEFRSKSDIRFFMNVRDLNIASRISEACFKHHASRKALMRSVVSGILKSYDGSCTVNFVVVELRKENGQIDMFDEHLLLNTHKRLI